MTLCQFYTASFLPSTIPTHLSTHLHHKTNLVKNLHPLVPRTKWPELHVTKAKERKRSIERVIWKIDLKKYIPKDANIFRSRFVLAIEYIDTDNPVLKARLIAQEHRNKHKNVLLPNSPTVLQSSIKMITSTTAPKKFKIWINDVTQAYLQSTENLLRNIYLHPIPDLTISSDELLLLLRVIYELPVASDC